GLSVELEEAGARGLRVPRRMARRNLTVGRGRRGARSEVDAVGPGLVHRSALVRDLDVQARESRRDGARNAAKVAAAVGESLHAAHGEIGEGHRPPRLLDAVGGTLIVADGINAAVDLAVDVLVAILEREERPVGRVDEALPVSAVALDPA